MVRSVLYIQTCESKKEQSNANKQNDYNLEIVKKLKKYIENEMKDKNAIDVYVSDAVIDELVQTNMSNKMKNKKKEN